MSNRIMNDDQWLNMLQECRSSGLTDRAWCAMQGIHPTTFYRAIKRLRQKSCAIPTRDTAPVSLPQEVVEVAKVDGNEIIMQSHHTEAAPLPCNDQASSWYFNFTSAASPVIPNLRSVWPIARNTFLNVVSVASLNILYHPEDPGQFPL